MKLTIRTDKDIFTFGVAPESGDHTAYVSQLLEAAKERGFVLIGNRAVPWHSISNVTWESNG